MPVPPSGPSKQHNSVPERSFIPATVVYGSKRLVPSGEAPMLVFVFPDRTDALSKYVSPAIEETSNHSRHEAPEKAWRTSFVESSIGPNAYHIGDRPGISSLTPLILYLRTMLDFSINFLISRLTDIYLIAGVDGILKLMSYSQVENETGMIIVKRKVFSLCSLPAEDRNGCKDQGKKLDPTRGAASVLAEAIQDILRQSSSTGTLAASISTFGKARSHHFNGKLYSLFLYLRSRFHTIFPIWDISFDLSKPLHAQRGVRTRASKEGISRVGSVARGPLHLYLPF
nr:putative mitochondrial protein [Tanacetum cinerariifolium]